MTQDFADRIDLAALKELVEKATPGENRCPEMLKPGGCQLHNLQCGFPDCDRAPGAKDAIELLRAKAPTLARQVLALSDEVERLRAATSGMVSIDMDYAIAERRARAAESEAQALRERMGEIREIAAQYKEHQYRWLEVEMSRIAALSTTPKEKETNHG